jgi:hypothetical protein
MTAPSSSQASVEAKIQVDLPTDGVHSVSLKQALLGAFVVLALYYSGPASGYAYHFATHDIVSALKYLPFSCQATLVLLSICAALYMYSSRVRYIWTYYTYSPKAAVDVEADYKRKQEEKNTRRLRSNSLRRSVLSGEGSN